MELDREWRSFKNSARSDSLSLSHWTKGGSSNGNWRYTIQHIANSNKSQSLRSPSTTSNHPYTHTHQKNILNSSKVRLLLPYTKARKSPNKASLRWRLDTRRNRPPIPTGPWIRPSMVCHLRPVRGSQQDSRRQTHYWCTPLCQSWAYMWLKRFDRTWKTDIILSRGN